MQVDVPEAFSGPYGVCALHVGAGGRVVSVLGDCRGLVGVSREELAEARLDRPSGPVDREGPHSFSNPVEMLSACVLLAVRHGRAELQTQLDIGDSGREVRAVASRTGDGVVMLLSSSAGAFEEEDTEDALQELKRCREALRICSAYLEQLFQSSHDGILVLDREGRVARVNGEFLRMFDYSLGEVMGRKPSEIIVPEGEHAFSDQLSELVRSGRRVSVTGNRRRRGGEEIHVSILGVPIEGTRGDIYVIYSVMPADTAVGRQRGFSDTPRQGG